MAKASVEIGEPGARSASSGLGLVLDGLAAGTAVSAVQMAAEMRSDRMIFTTVLQLILKGLSVKISDSIFIRLDQWTVAHGVGLLSSSSSPFLDGSLDEFCCLLEIEFGTVFVGVVKHFWAFYHPSLPESAWPSSRPRSRSLAAQSWAVVGSR